MMTLRRATFYYARVGRSDLDRLIRVASEGAPADKVKLWCRPNNHVITADDLDELIRRRAAHPSVNDRTPWTFLDYERDEDPDRNIQIQFRRGEVEVLVRSTDPIWAHGQWARIREILVALHGGEERTSFRKFLLWRWLALLVTATVTTAVLLVMEKLSQDAGNAPHEIVKWGVMSVWGIVFLAMTRTWFIFRSLKPAFSVTQEIPWGSSWSRLDNTERFAAIGCLIASMTLVVAVVALFVGP